MKKILIVLCVLVSSTFQLSALEFGHCPSDSYEVQSTNDEHAIVLLKNTDELITLGFDGCSRFYDMYDCYYSNDLYTLEENLDNGLGESDGFTLDGCN